MWFCSKFACLFYKIRLIMKHLLVMFAVAAMFSVTAKADDKPIAFEKLPVASQQFLNTNFPGVKILNVMQDDDLVRPDYYVRLAEGIKIDFSHCGALEKIECRKGAVPETLIPVQISGYVKSHYPGTEVVEYEVGRKGYELKLSNHLELKFNQGFHLIKIDD